MTLDVVVQHARHRRAQPGDVRAAVALRNVVGKREQALVVAVVPLHRDFDADRRSAGARFGADVEHVRMQHRFRFVDVLHEAFDTAGKCEVFFLGVALINQLDVNAVVQKREFAQPLRQHVIVKIDVGEDCVVG